MTTLAVEPLPVAPQGDVETSASPLWFGWSDRPLAGWLHLPADRQARAGVLLCPPMGIDAICTYFTYRSLATRLAGEGFAVLRFDYDGTGDSAGSDDDPDRVPAWKESVQLAAEVLLSTGVQRLAFAGIRVGGLLAAYETHRRGATDALVLWDPCLSGATFIRQEQARYKLAFGSRTDRAGAVNGLGIRFHPHTVAGLRGLDVTGLKGPLAHRTLMLTNPDGPPARRVIDRMTGKVDDWAEATGQSALLNPPQQTPPIPVIDRIVGWLSDVFEDAPAVPVHESSGRPASIVATSQHGPVSERFVSLGPSGLFGIVTEPAQPRTAPTIVFICEGNTPHVGQSRMWVELARRWAACGFRVLRWDLSGNGDSEARPGQEAHVQGAIEAFQDVDEVLSAISADDPSDVVLVGLCAGAYQSLEAALSLTPRGVCLLNPILTLHMPEDDDHGLRQAKPATRAWLLRAARGPVRRLARRRSEEHVTRWGNALTDAAWVAALARRSVAPAWLWRPVVALCIKNPPIHSLERAVRLGVDVLLLCNEADLQPIRLGATKRLARLAAADAFHLEVLHDLDHSILDLAQRGEVMDYLTHYLLARHGHR